ncbi:MAG: hypothetical protein IPL30_10135 [Elusimicrobia bacterium]|nr:hypothetical protein [Elusimicrobiota bacterium]
MTKKTMLEAALNKINQLSGKHLWGVLINVSGISFEIGEVRRYDGENKDRGELSVFSNAHWVISRENKKVVTKEDCKEHEKTKEINFQVDDILKDRPIKSVCVTKEANALKITFDEGYSIELVPIGEKKYWTLFFQYKDPRAQEWCSFYPQKIRFND